MASLGREIEVRRSHLDNSRISNFNNFGCKTKKKITNNQHPKVYCSVSNFCYKCKHEANVNYFYYCLVVFSFIGQTSVPYLGVAHKLRLQ